MIDRATQRVTTSASVSLLRAFFFRSGRRSSVVQNTAVPPTSTALLTTPAVGLAPKDSWNYSSKG
jgi:hypothetical protein